MELGIELVLGLVLGLELEEVVGKIMNNLVVELVNSNLLVRKMIEVLILVRKNAVLVVTDSE